MNRQTQAAISISLRRWAESTLDGHPEHRFYVTQALEGLLADMHREHAKSHKKKDERFRHIDEVAAKWAIMSRQKGDA
jgi:hypothetical protein